MKVAVEFYGHLRTWQYCMPTINTNLLSKYDCHVFMHTWSKTEASTKSWHSFGMKQVQSVGRDTVDILKRQYGVLGIEVEEQICPTRETFVGCEHNKGNVVSVDGVNFMLHSMFKVNELRRSYARERNVNYDWVIVLRPDIMIFNLLDLNLMEREMKCIGEPKSARYCSPNTTLPMKEFVFPTDSATDAFFFGRPDVIDRTISILHSLDLTRAGRIWNPESYFNMVLQQKGIQTLPITFIRGRDWNIVRESSVYVKRVKEGRPPTKCIAEPDVDINLVRDALSRYRLRARYIRCRALSHLTFGKTARCYKMKKRVLAERIRAVDIFLQSL